MYNDINALRQWFIFNGMPYWKLLNATTKIQIVENNTIEDVAAAFDHFEHAYNAFLADSTYILIVKRRESANDSKSPQITFIKGNPSIPGGSYGAMPNMAGMAGIGSVQPSNIASFYSEKEKEIKDLTAQISKLQTDLVEAKFNAKIEALERQNKESSKKKGIGEALTPIIEKHLPTILAFAGGRMAPTAAVGVADTTEVIPQQPMVNPIENQKANILDNPGFHSIDHAVQQLQELEDIFPEYNINYVLFNLALAAKTNPSGFKMLIENYL